MAITERVRLILEQTTRNPRAAANLARDIKSVSTAAKQGTGVVDRYGREINQVTTAATRATNALKKTERQIKQTNRASKSGGGGGLSGFAGRAGGAIRGVAGGAAGAVGILGGAAIGAGLVEFGRGALAAAAGVQRLEKTLDTSARVFNINRDAMRGTRREIEALGLTSTQALDAIQLFTRAGANQSQIVTLIGVAFDAAARRGLTLEDAVNRLALGVAKGEPELLDELGIVLKLGEAFKSYAKSLGLANANSLTAAQRAKAVVAAIAANAEQGGEFADTANTLSINILKAEQSSLRLEEAIGKLFTDEATAAAKAYASAVKGVADAVESINEQKVLETKFQNIRKEVEAALGFIEQVSPGFSAGGFVLPSRVTTGPTKAVNRRAQDITNQRFFESVQRDREAIELGKFADPGLALTNDRAVELDALAEAARVAATKAAAEAAKQLDSARKRTESLEKQERLAAAQTDVEKIILRARFEAAQAVTPGLASRLTSNVFQPQVQRALRGRSIELQRVPGIGTTIPGIVERLAAEQGAGLGSRATRTIGADLFGTGGLQRGLDQRAGLTRQVVDAEVRLAEIRSRSSGDILGVERARISAALRVFAITRDEAELQREVTQARLDSEIRVAELRQRGAEQFSESARQAFDALTSGGEGGFSSFIRSQFKAVQREIVGNAAGELFRAGGGLGLGSAIGGQVRDGKLTSIGRILQGTPLAVDPGELVQRENTTATTLNTAALNATSTELVNLRNSAISSSGGGGSAGAGGLIPSLLGAGGGFKDSDIVGLDIFGDLGGKGKKSGNLRKGIQAGIGIGTAIGGFRRGGTGGTLQGIGGAATAIAPFAGPAAPFVAAGGAILTTLSSFFGDSAEKRRREIEETIALNAASLPNPQDLSFAVSGASRDAFGGVRGSSTVTINISAIDAKSISDRSEDIVAAVRKGMTEDGGGTVDDFRTQLITG